MIDKAEQITNPGLVGVNQAYAGLEQLLAQADKARDDSGGRHNRQGLGLDQARVGHQFQQRFSDRREAGIGLPDEAA